MNTQNVAVIMATRDCDLAEAVSIASVNAAVSASVEADAIEVDPRLEYLMMQYDLVNSERGMPKREWKGIRGHRYPAKKATQATVIADDARRIVSVGGTQADFD
jgi:hypothetical protein